MVNYVGGAGNVWRNGNERIKAETVNHFPEIQKRFSIKLAKFDLSFKQCPWAWWSEECGRRGALFNCL